VTATLTFDHVIRHTVVYHSLTDGQTVTDIEIGFIRDRLEECTVDLIIRLKSNGRSRRSATQSREGRITYMSENEFVAVSQEQ